jgi:hypothetical protein
MNVLPPKGASRLIVGLACSASIVVGPAGATAQVSFTPPGDTFAAAQAVMNYWTPERMESAQPKPIPGAVIDPTRPTGTARSQAEVVGAPGLVAAHPPGQIPAVEQKLELKAGEYVGQTAPAPASYGAAPSEPRNGPYGPFQRWTMEGNYLTWPRSIHGKLFFSMGGSNFACSATVIGRSTVATAGHCVSDGAGTFGSNFLFCPSYYQGGVYPTRGCWSWSSATTSVGWHFSANPDHDYACIVTATAGTVVAGKIGNTTGTAGRAWNYTNVPEIIFGYPAQTPFSGNIIEMVATTDWYDYDFDGAGGQVSKIAGNDLTKGASGGGWFLGWRAPSAEVPDTDGSNATDPGTAGPFLNGVNSHKRCAVTCNYPPAVNNGVFWQELSSPPFRSTAAADESEDIFGVCVSHANNNP